MPEFTSISKQNPAFPAYLDFELLRKIGIEHLQKMSGKVWTDYNLHDPGVTILEVLCYAITDLGYRNNLEIQDLLTQKPDQKSNQQEDNFFTAKQVLTCNPVTISDLRKCLLNIQGVCHVWIKPYENYNIVRDKSSQQWALNLETKDNSKKTETESSSIQLKGLYTVILDLDPLQQDSTWVQEQRSWTDILEEVKAVLCSYRNLCEDVHEVRVLHHEAIRLHSTLEVDANKIVDVNRLVEQIFTKIQDFLRPLIKYYTLQELVTKGKSPIEIFEGRPIHDDHAIKNGSKDHGFITTEELVEEDSFKQIHVSSLYQIILENFPDVVTIHNLSIGSYINGVPQQEQEQHWVLNLTPDYRPILDIDNSEITVLRGGFPAGVDMSVVKRLYNQYRFKFELEVKRRPDELDWPVPSGTHYETLAEHYSIHYDFPATYGVGEDELPATVSTERKAQVMQLKGYLVFFDQLLANYLAQLANIRRLFSWRQSEKSDRIQTYFAGTIQFPKMEEIVQLPQEDVTLRIATPIIWILLKKHISTCIAGMILLDKKKARLAFWWKWYCKIRSDRSFKAEALDLWFVSLSYQLISRKAKENYLSCVVEEQNTALSRRDRFLDHMLARFAESFTDYTLLNYQNRGKQLDQLDYEKIQDKAGFLQASPLLSRDRFRAANYHLCHEDVLNTDQVSGFKKRISLLLGMKDYRRRALAHYKVQREPEQFSIRLRFLVGNDETERFLIGQKTYNSREEAERFRDNILNYYIHDETKFRKLKYVKAYHGLEVVDEDGTILAWYNYSYPTEVTCKAAIPKLVKQIHANGITIHTEETNGDFGFMLLIPQSQSDHSQSYPKSSFVSAQRYDTTEDACKDAERALKRLQHSANLVETFHRKTSTQAQQLTDLRRKLLAELEKIYHPISLYPEDVKDIDVRHKTVDGKLTTYGFAIVNDQEEILLELDSSLGFSSAQKRDQAIKDFQSAPLNVEIQQIPEGYVGYFSKDEGNSETILLKSAERFSTEEEAWKNGQILTRTAEAEKDNNFRRIDPESANSTQKGYRWVLVSCDQNDTIAIPPIDYDLSTKEYREQSIRELQEHISDEGFHVLEHILLRPRRENEELLPIQAIESTNTLNEKAHSTWMDPYSFWVSVILPAWPKRFRDKAFRQFVERTLRLEAPAHVGLKVAWVNIHQMNEFEQDYREWLTQLALATCNGEACGQAETLKHLIKRLSKLKSVYPKARLSAARSTDRSKVIDNSVILNQTPLGSIRETGYE